jgi:hypothetical protein
MKHNPVHSPMPPSNYPRTTRINVNFSTDEMENILWKPSYTLHPTRTFNITMIDSNSFSVTVPIPKCGRNIAIYQLLKLAINQQTGYDSVKQLLYSNETEINELTDFKTIDSDLTLLLTSDLILTFNLPIKYKIYLIGPDFRVYYGKITPNWFTLNRIPVSRFLNIYPGSVNILGIENGFVCVNLSELDKWLGEPYHKLYYNEPDIKAWFKKTNIMSIH